MKCSASIEFQHFQCFLDTLIKQKALEKKRGVILTTQAVFQHYRSIFNGVGDAFVIYVLPDGESVKNIQQYEKVLHFLADIPLKREDMIIGVGGGSLLDFAGFVAATYLRGVPYYSVPTTLLAMVDAAIGGKVGLNLDQGKNLVGTFYEPICSCVDLYFLETLSRQEWFCGMVEVIKMALLEGKALWDLLNHRPIFFLQDLELIQASIHYKQKIVNEDFCETHTTGLSRKILNLGHTLGHALETVSEFTYSHGQAVGIGLLLALRLSEKLYDLPVGIRLTVKKWLESEQFPVTYAKNIDISLLLAAMQRDKKNQTGGLQWILLKALGDPVCDGVPNSLVLETLYEFQSV